MRIISTHTHGILDYITGVVLVAAPWLFGFARGGPETVIPVVLGLGTLVYSMLTRYELGVFKVLPFRGHLTLDLISGVLLASSPWVFGFSDFVYLPHLLVGLFEIGAVLMTQTRPALEMGAPGLHHRAQ